MGLFDFLKSLFATPAKPPPLPTARASAPAPVSRPAPVTLAPARTIQRKKVTLDLEASVFTPMSHKQVKDQLAAVPLAWSGWFGRRDRIPPVEDARTRLIDRAMVGQGLITTEALTHIHELGRLMDEFRPDAALARETAKQAVEASKAERARIKAEKKAAAEERKRLHASNVAKRRATDIIFLGRGVSGGLANRQSNIEQLQSRGLPILSTPADVAAAMQLTIPRLRWLAFHSDAATVCHYAHFSVPKRSGGTRRLAAPLPAIAAAQRWVFEQILQKLSPHECAHGFVVGRSTVTNARPHVQAIVLANLDLTDFFPSITFPRVRGWFETIGYSPAVATVLALICTESPRKRVTYAGRPFFVAAGARALPQGACTSPALSNLISRGLDARLNGIATKLGYVYTRYADDLSFSTRDADAASRIGYLLARVRHIAQDESFKVNEKKTRIQKQSMRQEVTGIVVNTGTAVPRKTRRHLRAVLHDARRTGKLQVRTRPDVNPEGWVAGMIGYIAMANPAHGRKFS